MTKATPEQVRYKRLSLADKETKAVIRSIGARCRTGQPFTHEEQTRLLDVMDDCLSVYLQPIRAFVHKLQTGSSVYHVSDEHIAEVERVTKRLLELVRQLCGGNDRRDDEQASQPSSV